MPANRTTRKPQPASRRARNRGEETLYLQDPRDIRALAHPARLAIVDALASGDELTATDCAAITGLSPSATAYHLKILERYGFAEPAPARSDGRERPWRATLRSPQVDLDPTTPAGSAAVASVAGAFFDRTRAVAEAFIATEHEEPEEWRDVAALANADLWLTPEELHKMTDAFRAVLEPYRDRTLGEKPEKSRRVRVMTLAVPYRKT
jgi:DNA-binding transcriptional ArsR family regulator